MLDPWIIEEIRRREEEQRQREDQRTHLEIQIETPREPSDPHAPGWHPPTPAPSKDRGVTIIDLGQ